MECWRGDENHSVCVFAFDMFVEVVLNCTKEINFDLKINQRIIRCVSALVSTCL